MELGVFLNHSGAGAVARRAEELGYATALVPEGFRADAVSVLGNVAAQTSRITLAAGVMQIPARTPVMTALTAATLNALSGGRFRLGLGVSNPDVSLGWYAQPFDHPLVRTREYLDVVRLALRAEPVRYQGRYLTLPPAGTDETAHLRAAATPADIPIYLAAVGPKNLELAGEIADGWIGVFCSPRRIADSVARINAGRLRAATPSAHPFEVLPSVPIGVGSDPERAALPLRGYFANFIGLGDPKRSIYFRLAAELGHESAAAEIHRLRAAGDFAGAARAVPFELIDAVSLVGDPDRIATRMAAYAAAGVTTLGLTLLAPTVAGQLETVEAATDALRAFGSGTAESPSSEARSVAATVV
jgi:F420-dependent oxidoreductase-like protein